MIRVRLAASVGELKAAYRLLHDAYVRSEYQESDPSGMRILPQYLLPTAHTIVVVEQSQVVGTVTLVAPGVLGLPLDTDYRKESLPFRFPNGHPVEVSGLALRTRDPVAKFALFRAVYAYSRFALEATDLLITVTPVHERFYAHFLLFERVGPPRPCSQVKGAVGVLMRLHLKTAEERCRRRQGSGRIDRHLLPWGRVDCTRLTGELRNDGVQALEGRLRLGRELLPEAARRWGPDVSRLLLEETFPDGVRAPSGRSRGEVECPAPT